MKALLAKHGIVLNPATHNLATSGNKAPSAFGQNGYFRIWVTVVDFLI
jgi:hypothetical protein